MRHAVRLSVQEQYLRGRHHDREVGARPAARLRRHRAARRRDGQFAARLPELRGGGGRGCADAHGLRGDAALRRRLRRRAAPRCAGPDEVPAERDGRDRRPAGHDARLVRDVQPPAAPVRAARAPRPRTPRSCSTPSAQLAEHAEAEGVVIALEPLNRYENHMINTLGQARALCEKIGSPAPRHRRRHLPHEHRGGRSAEGAGRGRPWLRHVQLSDSNRLEPGAGHLDWTALLEAIWVARLRRRAGVRVPAVRPGGRRPAPSVRRMRQAAWA